METSLSFSIHISKLQSKVKAKLGFLYRNRSSFTTSAKLTLIQMTILPMLDYGDTIYRVACKSTLSKLDALYHSTIRFATNAPFNTHHCALYSSVNWPSLHNRRKIHWFTFIYKTLLGHSPPYLGHLLQPKPVTYNTRSSLHLQLSIPKTNSAFGLTSFQSAATSDWNALQNILKLDKLIPISSFKTSISYLFTDICSCFTT